jgi:hypothetical protein
MPKGELRFSYLDAGLAKISSAHYLVHNLAAVYAC